MNLNQKGDVFSRGIATLCLFLMLIQYFPIEGGGTSLIKVAFMCMSPFIIFLFAPYITSAVVYGGLYLLWIFSDMYLRFLTPRTETIVYSFAFFITYMMFYNLVCRLKVFSIDYFVKLMRILIYMYTVVLILQQLVSLAGMNTFPLINLGEHTPAMKCQSLSLEPSHSARILTAAFYAIIRMTDIQTNSKRSIAVLWKREKWVVICFLYSMLSMVSGTAIACVFLVFLSFLSLRHLIYFLLIIPLLYYLANTFQNEQVERVVSLTNAILSGGDVESIIEADHSASFRVMPTLNIFSLDFTDLNTWIGYGTDSFKNMYADLNSRILVNVTIFDYGFIAYILSLCIVFKCCIYPFFSLMTLLFFTGLGGATVNGAYGWGILMIFTCVSYFSKNKIKEESEEKKKTNEIIEDNADTDKNVPLPI